MWGLICEFWANFEENSCPARTAGVGSFADGERWIDGSTDLWRGEKGNSVATAHAFAPACGSEVAPAAMVGT